MARFQMGRVRIGGVGQDAGGHHEGGGLVRAMLNDKRREFTPRALTRDINSAKAKELAKLGAEVVVADVNDFESMKKGFAGAYGAFCVTFFWEHMSPEREIANATT